MENKVIPVTIITGFLGSGKTTLLNNLLRRYSQLKILIIENEVGEINIDRDIISKGKNANVYELTNGCICCSLNKELGTVLNSIILSKTDYDYLLIEATGIADPGEIIQMFNGERVQRYFRLDGVITLADGHLINDQLPQHFEVRSQINHANHILVNKTDLVDKNKLQEITDTLKSINPFAKINLCSFCNTDHIELLNLHAYHPDTIEKSIINFNSLYFAKSHELQSASLTLNGDFQMEDISEWLETYLQSHTKNILRIKGVLSIKGMKHKIILQSVANDFQIYQGDEWTQEEIRISRLVFIGKKIDEEQIQEELGNLC
ncbi:GTP-binding protein [Labilibacter sediminis]|nr:GTP-binding protein [Labilibacter sediminis]